MVGTAPLNKPWIPTTIRGVMADDTTVVYRIKLRHSGIFKYFHSTTRYVDEDEIELFKFINKTFMRDREIPYVYTDIKNIQDFFIDESGVNALDFLTRFEYYCNEITWRWVYRYHADFRSYGWNYKIVEKLF